MVVECGVEVMSVSLGLDEDLIEINVGGSPVVLGLSEAVKVQIENNSKKVRR